MKTEPNFTAKLLVLFCFMLIFIPCFSQKDTVVYIGTNGKLTTLKDAIYQQKVTVRSPKLSKVQTYQLKNSKWEKLYTEHYKKLNDSTYQIKESGEEALPEIIRTFSKIAAHKWAFTDAANDLVIKKGHASSIMPLLYDGQVTEYYPGGAKKSVSTYKANELVSNENWKEDGQQYIGNIFYSADIFPTYSQGNKALHEHVMQCYKNSGLDLSTVNGSVLIGFVVMENGTVDGIKVLKGLGPKINETACKAFKTLQGKWTPARLNNHTVRYFQVFPINFIYKETFFEYAELRDAVLHYQTF